MTNTVLFCADMSKKKVTIALKAQLKQALLLHAITQTAVEKTLPAGKGSRGPVPAIMSVPLTQVPPEASPTSHVSSTGLEQLVQHKRRRTGM